MSESVYVLIALEDERVKECVVVESYPLAVDLRNVLIRDYGGANVCMASRCVDEVPQNLIDAIMPTSNEVTRPCPEK